MTQESRAFAAVRGAVRAALELLAPGSRIGIAVSGGADSLALAAATKMESEAGAHQLTALIVDHRLQPGSNQIARDAMHTLQRLGIDHVEILEVEVEITDGLESSARRARYGALASYAENEKIDLILLGHTKNDQAETVLLGLARGSGTRSLSGMAERKGIFLRPLLAIERQTTERACSDLAIVYWQDPHNEDERFKRVRARRLMVEMERQIGPGIVDALARSAELLRDDADALDAFAKEYFESIDPRDIEVASLARLPRALRTRILRMAIYANGAPAGSLSSDHIAPIEALVSNWHGQGPASVPGGVKVERKSGRLSLSQPGQ